MMVVEANNRNKCCGFPVVVCISGPLLGFLRFLLEVILLRAEMNFINLAYFLGNFFGLLFIRVETRGELLLFLGLLLLLLLLLREVLALSWAPVSLWCCQRRAKNHQENKELKETKIIKENR